MKKSVTLAIACLMIATTSVAQVQIQSRLSRSGLSQVIQRQIEPKTPVYRLPAINLKQLESEDQDDASKGKPYRFGKDVDVNIDVVRNSLMIEDGESVRLLYSIASKGAYSINLIFDQFTLSENASLLIYNYDRSMVYGPITQEHNPSKSEFWTDLIKGDQIVIELTTDKASISQNRLHISKIIHGYQNTFAGFGQSDWCNRDIACAEGNNWRGDGNSVAMLLLNNGTRFCSGVLMNNGCNDLTPTLLTAFHCLDLNQNGALTAAEQNAIQSWVFRFFYESPSCGGPDDANFLSINGAMFRAAHQPTDFALMQLYSRPTGPGVAYAGWSRAAAAATSAAAIHHPNGDVKKISIDNNALTNVNQTTNWGNGVTCPPNTHWQSIYESGTVQPGSSGSPIFDQNHRVVGQLHGDFLNTTNNFCANRRGHYGRFDVSWNGGGTAATRLSTWLTNDPSITQVNTLVIPDIAGSFPPGSCSGTTRNFSIVNPQAGVSYLWRTSNGLQIVGSNTGNTVTLRVTGNGNQWVSISNVTACGTYTLTSRTVSVGIPQTIVTTSDDRTPQSSNYTYHTARAEQLPGTVPSNYRWYNEVNGAATSLITTGLVLNQWPIPPCTSKFYQLQITTTCGTAVYRGYAYNYYGCGGYYNISASPNPVTSVLTVERMEAPPGFKSDLSTEDALSIITSSQQRAISIPDLMLYDRFGTKVLTQQMTTPKTELNVSHLPRGIYFLKIFDGPEITTQRVVIDK